MCVGSPIWIIAITGWALEMHEKRKRGREEENGWADELFLERAALRGGVELKFASLVPHITSPITWAPFSSLAMNPF